MQLIRVSAQRETLRSSPRAKTELGAGCGVNFHTAKGGGAGAEFAGVGVGSQLGLGREAVCG